MMMMMMMIMMMMMMMMMVMGYHPAIGGCPVVSGVRAIKDWEPVSKRWNTAGHV